MDGGLLPELFCQVVEPLQPPDLIQQPLLIALLRLLQAAPGIIDVLQGWQAQGQPAWPPRPQGSSMPSRRSLLATQPPMV